jgi:large subunit ribosomal protein L9
MQVILLERVEKLGDEGDVVDVADGHARNYLFPQKLAIPATQTAIQQAQARKEKRRQKKQSKRDKASHAATQLDGASVTLTKKVNDSGTLYAAVTEDEVLEAAAEKHGAKTKGASVAFDEPIKETGSHKVTVDFEAGDSATLTVNVKEA